MEIIKDNTPNQSTRADSVSGLVLHMTLGSYKGAISWLKNPASQVSAHFVISREGEITQLVDIDRKAWHAGNVSNPSEVGKQILKKAWWGYKNPNDYTVGIEFAAGYDVDKDGVIENWEKLFTKEQVKSCAWLVLNVIEPATGIPFNSSNIVSHKDIASYKSDCPDVYRQTIAAEIARQREQGGEIPRVAVKAEGASAVYITCGDIAVPIATTWEQFQEAFPNAKVVELPQDEFKEKYKPTKKVEVRWSKK